MTDDILTHPTEAELANAVQENLFDLFRAMAAALDGEIEETDRLCRHLAFPTNPMYKGVWRTRLSAAEADEGYHYAVLFSTEMGIHAYERIGFRLTDARLNRYLWRNQ